MGEMAVGLHQKLAIALVADQRLVALLQLPFERGQDRSPGGGVLPHLVVVAADDVAPPGERHRLGLVVDLLLRLVRKNGTKGARSSSTSSRTSLSLRSRTPRM